jgi:hypothetical protein
MTHPWLREIVARKIRHWMSLGLDASGRPGFENRIDES